MNCPCCLAEMPTVTYSADARTATYRCDNCGRSLTRDLPPNDARRGATGTTLW